MRGIVTWSLKFRLLVVAAAAVVMGVGVAQLRDAPVEVLPEFTPPYVEIQTEALGLSAEEVEQLITVPLEADLLNGVAGVDVIRSESVPGLSSVVLVFEPETDLFRGRQLVQEQLTQAHALPNVSRPPTMLQPLSSASRVMMIGLSSDKLTPIQQGVLARWTMKPALMGVPGVANVAIWGQRERELQVQVDPERLRDKNVTLNQVVATAGNAQVVSPLSFLEASTPGTGGFIETPQQRFSVQHVFDKLANPAELGKVSVEDTNGRLRLTDVASVVEDHQPLIGDAVVNGGDGLMLVVEKLPGTNTREVTEGVEAALERLEPGLSGMRVDPSVFRPATFVQEAVGNVGTALLIGGVLLVLTLAAFLFEWRALVISIVTIPLSLLAAGLVLDLRGETFNALVFAGLAVALVVVIDDAVAGVHAVARRLRTRDRGEERSLSAAVVEATIEARSPLAYATLIILLAAVPVLIVERAPGAFFEPLAISYMLAVVASMVVALTVTPALSMLLFGRGRLGSSEPPVARALAARYGAVLARFVRRPGPALGAAAVAGLAGLALLALMGTSVIPTFKDRDVLMRLDGQPGTSQPEMSRVAREASRQLREIPGVENVGAHVGRAVTGDRIVDVNSSDLWVSIDGGADYDATLASVEGVADRFRGFDHEVVGYANKKITDVGALREGHHEIRTDNLQEGGGRDLDVLTGADKPLVVRVFGQDIDELRRQAEAVRRAVAGVDGVVDPQVELPRTERSIEIEVDLARAERFGIKPGDVRRAQATLMQGISVGSIFNEQKVYEVIVKGVPATRSSVAGIRDLLVDRPGGGHVRLGQVADVRITAVPTVVQRDAVSRRLDVEADVSGRSVGDVAGDVEARLADLRMPLEYHAEVLEQGTGEAVNAAKVLGMALAAAIGAFLLFQAALRSWRLAAVAFLTLPAALLGGALGALVDGAELTLGALVGLLALLALASRNAITLLRHFERLEDDGHAAFGRALVLRGATERLAPILTTVAATALVLAPFAILGSRPGLEILGPMAVVVLCGLVSSTALSLFVLPALYLRFGAGRRPHPERDEDDRTPLARTGNGVPPLPTLDEAPERRFGRPVLRADGATE